MMCRRQQFLHPRIDQGSCCGNLGYEMRRLQLGKGIEKNRLPRISVAEFHRRLLCCQRRPSPYGGKWQAGYSKGTLFRRIYKGVERSAYKKGPEEPPSLFRGT